MLEKLKNVEKRYETVNEMLFDPQVVSDQENYKALMKELKNLTPVVEKYREYIKIDNNVNEAWEMLNESGLDRDLREMAQEEFDLGKEERERCYEELKILLLPKDENDDKNVIIEIRGGAGGEEASLFAGSLYKKIFSYLEIFLRKKLI